MSITKEQKYKLKTLLKRQLPYEGKLAQINNDFVIDWCNNNCKGKYYILPGYYTNDGPYEKMLADGYGLRAYGAGTWFNDILFEDKNDAILFKLTVDSLHEEGKIKTKR